MSRGFNFRLWCLHRMLLTHVMIIITVTALFCVRAQDVLSMSHEIKARIEPPEDVPQTQRPVITSSTSRLHVLIGSMVVFPCKVENLGSNVVLWKRGFTHVLFTGTIQVDRDPSISLLTDNSLKIRSVMPEHSGTYICSVRSSPPMELEHFLEVLVPPKVKPIPPDGQIVAKKDDSVTLECLAEGHPSPMITWKTSEGSLPRGIPEKQGSRLTIPSVDTYHSGEYQCKADNEVGDPVTARFKVKVLYSPEITVKPTWVHAGLGSSTEFSCSVSAEPSTTIRWTKSSGSVLEEDNHIRIRTMGSSSEVKIRHITEDHLETYNCTASNFLGSSYATVEVSGLAEPASIQSNSTGEDDTSFLLLWTVKSYSPVIEYMLNVRRRKEDSARDQPESAWIPVMIPIDIQQSLFHSQSYNVTGLEPATAYEAIIQARNEYGWNHPSDTFVFYTYGREQSQDVMEEQPFEPTTLLHPVTNLQDKKEGQEEKENIVEMGVKRNIARQQVMDYMTSVLIIFSALAVFFEL